MKTVAKAATLLEAKKKGQEKVEYTKEEVNSVICVLGDQCIGSVFNALKKVVENMSFIKTMVEKQLPQGMTVDMLAEAGTLYFAQTCATVDPIEVPEEPIKTEEL